MYPQDQPQQTYYPQGVTPQTGMPPTLPPETEDDSDDNDNKKLYFIIAGIGAAVILIIVVVLIVVAGGSKSKKVTSTPAKSNSTTGSVSPATWLTLQQNSDAINQNLSNLNDTTDFQANALSDSTLTNGH